MTCPRCRGLLRPDEDGLLVCCICSHAAGPRPLLPLAVPGVKQFRDTPPAKPDGERQARHRAILLQLMLHTDDSHGTISRRLGVSVRTVSRVADRYGVSKRMARLVSEQATYHEQQRRLFVGGKARGKTHVA